ncbi:MAG: hypothetical protein L0H32_10890 [Micrococcaceae bacterium]|nr:hypothetical protein [Micrococcaceae bacterium]
MVIDATGLEDWPEPAIIDSATSALAKQGKDLCEKVEDCETAWKGLYPGFTTKPETAQEKVRELFDLITTHGAAVKGATSLVKDATEDFASKIRELETRKTEARLRISEHDKLVAAGTEVTAGIYTTDMVQEYVNILVGDLVKAAENCSSTLEGIDGQAIESAGLLKPELGAGDYVTMAAWTTFDSVIYNYTVPTAVRIPLWDYSTTAPSADWVGDVDGNITRAPFITGPEQVGSRVEIQDVEHTGTKKAWTGMRTPINQWAYERFDWYKNRVDTHSTLYTQGGPRFWDVKGRILDFEDAMRNGGKLTKALRVAGPIATVATIGLTYKGEYDQAAAELAADHPDWTEDEISARAREMAGVQGTVQVGLDIGAGMAGAAIGTAIGGPVGTVIGFGVGIGLSWVLNESGIGDGIKNVVQDIWDGGKDLVEGAGDKISDAWNSVFG